METGRDLICKYWWLAMLIPSVSFKDRTVVEPSVEIEHSLLLSWSDKSFRPRSRVTQFVLEIWDVWRAHWRGGCMCRDAYRTLGRPLSEHLGFRLVPECATQLKPTTISKLYQRWPKTVFALYAWVYVMDSYPAGCNGFESPSLLNSEKLD
jgi:hypothetical protein